MSNNTTFTTNNKKERIMRTQKFDAHIQDYNYAMLHPVYKFKLPELPTQVEHIKQFPVYDKKPEPARDYNKVMNYWYKVEFRLPNKPVEIYTGKICHINAVGNNVYYTLQCGKLQKVFTRAQKNQGHVIVTAVPKPKVSQYKKVDLDTIKFEATEILQLDRRAAELDIQGKYNISTNSGDVKKRYYAAINNNAVTTYTEDQQLIEVPTPFNKLVIQYYRLTIYKETDKFIKWAIMNMETTRFIIKDIVIPDKAHNSTKEPGKKDIVAHVNSDVTIQKGDFTAYNAMIQSFTTQLNKVKESNILEDNLKRIEALYTPEIRELLGIINLNRVLTARFEQRIQDAIRKYGKDYGIELPTRTKYDEDEYHTFKKDVRSKNNSNDKFQFSFTIYEDPNDQKTFIDNSQTYVVPRKKADIEKQTEELVELHTRFIQLMYFVKTGLDIIKDTQSDNFIVESLLEAERLRHEEDLMNYKHFCEVNGLDYNPDNFYSDTTPEELDNVQVDTAYIH